MPFTFKVVNPSILGGPLMRLVEPHKEYPVENIQTVRNGFSVRIRSGEINVDGTRLSLMKEPYGFDGISVSSTGDSKDPVLCEWGDLEGVHNDTHRDPKLITLISANLTLSLIHISEPTRPY